MPYKWCDEIASNILILPAKETISCARQLSNIETKARCHYAMNPNCEPNSPPDTVLLFESKGGWNQHGGPEFLTFDNHVSKIRLMSVYNNGGIKLIKPERSRQIEVEGRGKRSESARFTLNIEFGIVILSVVN